MKRREGLADSAGAGRVHSLDALRGLAILLMVLSAVQPFGNLPAWMYHGQVPPPGHQFDPEIAGITWVDLVFPFFIFSMGAAIPLSLGRRLAKGIGSLSVVGSIFKRGALLLGFAIYTQHFYPWVIDGQGRGPYAAALVGFGMVFPLWARMPAGWGRYTVLGVRAGGLAVVGVMFGFMSWSGGEGFSVFRSNVILHVLANIAVFGSLIWLFTRDNVLLRVGVLGLMLAVNLSFSQEQGWIWAAGTNYDIGFLREWVLSLAGQEGAGRWRWVYNYSWVVQWRYLKYLFVLIPGTIAAEQLAGVVSLERTERCRWGRGRLWAIAGAMLLVVLIQMAGLYLRWGGWHFVVSLASVGLAGFLFVGPGSEREIGLRGIFGWGVFWLVLGLLFEPYEGGIKKDPSTISYYFVTAGLSIFVLIMFVVLCDYFRESRRPGLLVLNGQNPMIAYLGNSNILVPLLVLTGLRSAQQQLYSEQAWVGFILAIGLVLGVAFLVGFFSRRGVFLRT